METRTRENLDMTHYALKPHVELPEKVIEAFKQRSPNETLLACSFCGKSEHEVEGLIVGALLNVCSECAELHWRLILESRESDKTPPHA